MKSNKRQAIERLENLGYDSDQIKHLLKGGHGINGLCDGLDVDEIVAWSDEKLRRVAEAGLNVQYDG